MKIIKNIYFNIFLMSLILIIVLKLIDYFLNRSSSIFSMVYAIGFFLFLIFSFRIGQKYYEKRFKTMKREDIKKKYPLYFVKKKFKYYFIWLFVVIPVFLILYYLLLQNLIGWTGLSMVFLGSLPVLIAFVYFIALAFYYLYKSKRITQKILIILIFIYFLIIPIMIVSKNLTLVRIALIFTAISLIIFMIYDIYIIIMYSTPALIEIALKKAKQKQQALKSEKALSRHGKGREKSRKGSYSV